MRFANVFTASLILLPAIASTEEPGASPVTFATVMERLSSSPGFRAEFTEFRHLSLLDEPLESRGTLYFLPPDRMARLIDQPEPAVMIAAGSVVQMRDAFGTETLNLDSYPVAQRLIENLTVVLRGDRAALEKRYEVDFEIKDGRWVLRLKPRSAVIKKLIASIRLNGTGEVLSQMTVTDASGDRTETRFENVSSRYRFEPDEIAKVFDLAP